MRPVSFLLVLLLPLLSQAFLTTHRFSSYDPLSQETVSHFHRAKILRYPPLPFEMDDNRAQFLPSGNSYCFFHRDICRRLASTEKRFYSNR